MVFVDKSLFNITNQQSQKLLSNKSVDVESNNSELVDKSNESVTMQDQKGKSNESVTKTNTSSNDKVMFTTAKMKKKLGRPTQKKKEMKPIAKAKRNVRKTVIPPLLNESNIITILETLEILAILQYHLMTLKF